ncbi:hypothetical protein [Actinomadura sediminis]|uniref:DUF4878 domain-containing protein n=1 Tax=Actinomadura sediminis TaxID=1038904 RepID=A0ABW3ENB0_9ACTN
MPTPNVPLPSGPPPSGPRPSAPPPFPPQGPPPQRFAPQRVPPPFPSRNGKGRTARFRTVAAVAAVSTLAVLSGAAYGVYRWTHRDEARVHATVERFAHAVDREDMVTTLGLLCDEEARSLIESGVPEKERGGDGSAERPVETSDVRIIGDLAEVRLTRPSQEPATLYLRKEGGSWKMCDPERDRWPG